MIQKLESLTNRLVIWSLFKFLKYGTVTLRANRWEITPTWRKRQSSLLWREFDARLATQYVPPTPRCSLNSSAMEDAHTTILDLNNNTSADSHVSFFAVFDGHGGPSVAQYVGEKLHSKILSMPAYKAKDYKEALRTAFFALDDDIANGTHLLLFVDSNLVRWTFPIRSVGLHGSNVLNWWEPQVICRKRGWFAYHHVDKRRSTRYFNRS